MMSRYCIDKFLFAVDRDPELPLQRGRPELRRNMGAIHRPKLNDAEVSTVHALNEEEREALVNYDFAKHFGMGAYFFSV
jgi:hypothetical protein